jgi:hypothetical protein
MKWKGCGRKLSCPNFRYHAGVCLGDLSKTTKNSIRTTDLRVEIRTRDLQSTKQEFCPLDRRVRFAFICWIPRRFASDTQGSPFIVLYVVAKVRRSLFVITQGNVRRANHYPTDVHKVKVPLLYLGTLNSSSVSCHSWRGEVTSQYDEIDHHLVRYAM